MPSIALKCSAGQGEVNSLHVVHVNADSEPVEISNDDVEARLVVRIRDFHGDAPKGKEALSTAQSGYFDEHPKVTWSMQLQLRFKSEFDGDEVVFGNVFEKPIRDYLPYGTSAALKFVHVVDPSLDQDIYADKPWAWSPLIATMQQVHLSKSEGKLPEWSPKQPTEDVSAGIANANDAKPLIGNPDARRKYFSKPDKRKAVKLGPDTIVDADFCNGFLNFDTLSLRLYAGLEFGLAKYWNGEPVVFVCRTRGGKEFFKISFTIVDQSIVQEVQQKQGSSPRPDAKADADVSAADKAEEAGAEDKDTEGID